MAKKATTTRPRITSGNPADPVEFVKTLDDVANDVASQIASDAKGAASFEDVESASKTPLQSFALLALQFLQKMIEQCLSRFENVEQVSASLAAGDAAAQAVVKRATLKAEHRIANGHKSPVASVGRGQRRERRWRFSPQQRAVFQDATLANLQERPELVEGLNTIASLGMTLDDVEE